MLKNTVFSISQTAKRKSIDATGLKFEQHLSFSNQISSSLHEFGIRTTTDIVGSFTCRITKSCALHTYKGH